MQQLGNIKVHPLPMMRLILLLRFCFVCDVHVDPNSDPHVCKAGRIKSSKPKRLRRRR
jgi:hypothetical protein